MSTRTTEQTVTVLSVHPTGERIAVAEGETVLEALYNAGYAYRIGCRRGGCAICKVDLLSGSVTYNAAVCETVLTEDERAAGTCLSCRAVPDGPVTIALREDELRLINPFQQRLRKA